MPRWSTVTTLGIAIAPPKKVAAAYLDPLHCIAQNRIIDDMTNEAETTTVSAEQCWECRRRRLVCDGVQPVCKKCRTTGIVCPGYADKKPLTWLAPGQVISRPRRRKANGTPSNQILKRTTQTTDTRTHSQESGDSGRYFHKVLAQLGVQELRPESCDIIEAMMYYNAHMFPDLKAHQFGPSNFVFPLENFQRVPLSVLHTLVSITISHRILQASEGDPKSTVVKRIRPRLYHHRGIAIRAINELVGKKETRSGQASIVSVYAFLFAMLQQSMTPSWRTHVDGFMILMEPWGPTSALARNYEEMRPSLMGLLISSVLANTTSPAHHQFHMDNKEETFKIADEFYTETYYPAISMPPSLFLEVITTNRLRSEGSSTEITTSALATLERIEAFSPDKWAASHESLQDDWLITAQVFQATVALFCILSLQSTGALPRSAQTELARARHARQLFALLEKGMATPRMMKRLTWPLIVAGVEAERASREVQKYIIAGLRKMAIDQGITPPLVAGRLLERFWSAGKTRWDDCFDDAYALVL
ncbi:putative C6 zinc finger domain protein [Podospora australis]|uniref:C6 zinc finger domain protein n=1 Tax=Podospora australis TaxID=1536484 RepID=A0AAN6WYZ4_9PEZI|nr:putative C6 zinc finger domain protein [Podospora australis]